MTPGGLPQPERVAADARTILDWPTLQRVFDAAVQLPAGERGRYLDEACGEGTELRRQVESLLVSLDAFDAAVPLKLVDGVLGEVGTVPEAIGPYQVLRLLGEGGMGAVYLAERADAAYRQQVAIKVTRSLLLDGAARTRFRAERQILANLSHPNIARLLDGGTTAAGAPYLVMEFVDGVPITEWCARNQVGTPQKLKLFLSVCAAVQAAHQNLVIHRDIKPGNILVTPDGTPKLLDFGIAKLLEPATSGITVALTGAQDRLLTPQYASPEQFSGEPVTTASDVYSLGTLLYELISGDPPFSFGGQSLLEIEKTLRTVTPPRLPGDLGQIIAKAMHKEPARRYASASELGLEIERLLAGQPVLARPDSARYRLGLWARRNRGLAVALGVLAVTAVLLVASLGAGLYFTRQSQLRAERRFAEVRSLANALIFDVHDRVIDLQGSLAARKFIVERAMQSLSGLEKESAGDAAFRAELAGAWRRVGMMQYLPGGVHIGDMKGSIESLERAWKLIEPLQQRQPGDVTLAIEAANILSTLAFNRQSIGGAKPGEVRSMLAKAHGIIEPVRTVDALSAEQAEKLLTVHMRYGASLQTAGELRPALTALETTERLCRAALARHGEVAGIRWLLGNSIYRQGDVYGGGAINLSQFPKALEKYQEAEAMYAALGRKYPDNARYNAGTFFIYQRIASANERLNRLDEAIAFTRQWGAKLATVRRADPNNHEALRELAISHANLGTLLQKAGRLREAAAEARDGLRLHREHAARSPGAQPLGDVGIALLSLAIIEWKSGQPSIAMQSLHEARDRFQEAIRLSPDLPALHWRLGRVYEWMGKVHGATRAAACREAYTKAAAEFELLRDTNRIAEADRGEPARFRELAGSCANARTQ